MKSIEKYYDTFDRVVNSVVMMYLILTKDFSRVVIKDYTDSFEDKGILYSLLIGNDLQNKTLYIKGYKNYRAMKKTLEDRADVKWGHPLCLLWNKNKIVQIDLQYMKEEALRRTEFHQEVPSEVLDDMYSLIYENYYLIKENED